jgi:hypothetical protein
LHQISNQINHITMLLISSFTSFYWVKLDHRRWNSYYWFYRRNNPSYNIIQKANVYAVCWKLGVLNEKRCKKHKNYIFLLCIQ